MQNEQCYPLKVEDLKTVDESLLSVEEIHLLTYRIGNFLIAQANFKDKYLYLRPTTDPRIKKLQDDIHQELHPSFFTIQEQP